VRLRYAYIIKCEEVVKDPTTGAVLELRCSYDSETKSGSAQSGRKVKATLHWVSAEHAVAAEVRLYDYLFTAENPEEAAESEDWTKNLNPNSLETLVSCRVERHLSDAPAGAKYQFERMGYFTVDRDSTDKKPVFNRTATLRDAWAKIEKSRAR
jgi:glutaminyl-tRNA synthetase